MPIRTLEATTQATTPVTYMAQPISVAQVLAFTTLVLENIHPFQRHHILQQIQYAARTVLKVNFNATYSEPHAHFHSTVYETEV